VNNCTKLRTICVRITLKRMREPWPLCLLFLLGLVAVGQAPRTPVFEVASVKPSERPVGVDYNNQFIVSPSGITARNATLRRLVSEAYRLQLRQVLGPSWLDQNDYDIEARTSEPTSQEQLDLMLRVLLAARFNLRQHSETRVMRVYALLADNSAKLHRMESGETAKPDARFHFHEDMRRFADFLAVQLSIPILDDPAQPARAGGPAIPVLDRTELLGVHDLTIDVKSALGTDSFSLWQRALRDPLGLRIESRRGPLEVVVVDEAARIPTAN
jgi:uncharacterized protein (TIGR03435 family)